MDAPAGKPGDARADVVVVGGGIVGMATAWQLTRTRPGTSVLVLEKESRLAGHQTGHNSGVVHSGIYYLPGSLKARLCREGARATKEFAAEHGIPLQECGKLLVATDDAELVRMDALHERARENGIDVERIDAAELRRREPNVRGVGALFVTETAITDYPAVTRALGGLVTAAGGSVRTGTAVLAVRERRDSVLLSTTTGDVTARRVVFCGGLQADRLARLAGIEPDFRIVPFRGEYYDVVAAKAGLVSTLVYPIPDPELPFLGVHLTLTLDGGLTVGPNAVLGLAREGYPRFSWSWPDVRDMAAFGGMWRAARGNARTGIREMRNSLWKRGYLEECRKYAPDLLLDDLVPREAGIRAQAVLADGSFVHDFLLRSTARTLHVINAPSPAATSALPIGAKLAGMTAASLDAAG